MLSSPKKVPNNHPAIPAMADSPRSNSLRNALVTGSGENPAVAGSFGGPLCVGRRHAWRLELASELQDSRRPEATRFLRNKTKQAPYTPQKPFNAFGYHASPTQKSLIRPVQGHLVARVRQPRQGCFYFVFGQRRVFGRMASYGCFVFILPSEGVFLCGIKSSQ